MKKMVVLRLDGEIWECASGYDTDENSIGVRLAQLPRDKKAINAGITHVQTVYTEIPAHEVRRIKP